MFFRLPKNTIKNLHFGPFGGGVPPLPPSPLNIASAYAFTIKITIFSSFKEKIYFFFLGGGGCWQQPPPCSQGGRQQDDVVGGANDSEGYSGGCIVYCHSIV